ncbi:glycosyltransferase family 4 protein [Neorhizobium alkalisoli]|uniref:Glycosyl transferase family 4 n=1 Tax=Neorhizobium alkalisoli TaxID=528178 RepID=A0A561QCL7_9HYPH|nr:glycosyltransferase family 4 protein [Neorhizobium alkalisoli]TWF48082.1 glycosyl transferase family 4 [Neorhizobium alkalisoli]
MKLAYFVLPHVGGTYSVFKSLHTGLAEYGIDVRWFGICRDGYELPAAMQQEISFGHLLKIPGSLTERGCAQRMADAIGYGGFDGVFINVLGDRMQTNIARYLPEHILRIVVVHNITPGTYAAARSIRDYAHATIGVSERCRVDLVEGYGFSPDHTHVIENSVNTNAFSVNDRGRKRDEPKLRALFVGRVEDASKGVLWLREILDALPETVTLTVAGSGPDIEKLKRRLTAHWNRVTYLGSVSPERIPAIMAEHDALIMPSRYEGLPMTLIEAMAAGCVPVVSHIRAVTDTVVDHEITGFLFPVGNYTAAASALARLHDDRDLLARMSIEARGVVPKRYGVERMAGRYNDVIRSIAMTRPKLSPMLDMDAWAIPSGLRPGLRTYLPLPLKNWLRVMRERL